MFCNLFEHCDAQFAASQTCFQEWVAAMEETLAAEFPAWHVLQCFDIFELTQPQSRPDLSKQFATLAQAFQVNEEKLKEQYMALMPVAQSLQRRTDMDNRSAWRQVLQRKKGASKRHSGYECDALLEALVAKSPKFASESVPRIIWTHCCETNYIIF